MAKTGDTGLNREFSKLPWQDWLNILGFLKLFVDLRQWKCQFPGSESDLWAVGWSSEVALHWEILRFVVFSQRKKSFHCMSNKHW